MSIKEYLNDKLLFIIINIIMAITICSIMLMANFGSAVVFLTLCIWFLPLTCYIFVEYTKRRKYYKRLYTMMMNLDKKYLLPEVMKEPQFVDGIILHELLSEACRDMHENVKNYRDLVDEYKQYIEAWVHEIKTPIASAGLIISNNENSVTKNIAYEIKKVEEYIEQVLYYSRSTDVSKDYIIRETYLCNVVRTVIKNNSRYFINKKLSIDIENLDGVVYSDSKWIEFILNQIVSNSIKYSGEKIGKITIYSTKTENSIILTVEDNGVGIAQRDIQRVFDKGFTGENGRIYGKSTGIGLYLCKNLCKKLGLGINLTSQPGFGTKVNIIFPVGNTKF